MRLLPPIAYSGLTLPRPRNSVDKQGVITSEAEVLVDGGPEIVAERPFTPELGWR
jgi:hypothetical protein